MCYRSALTDCCAARLVFIRAERVAAVTDRQQSTVGWENGNMWKKKKSCYIRCAQCECEVSKWASSETAVQAWWSAVQRACKTHMIHFLLCLKIIKDSESTGESRLGIGGVFTPPWIYREFILMLPGWPQAFPEENYSSSCSCWEKTS